MPYALEMDAYFISHKTADEYYSRLETRKGKIVRVSRAYFRTSRIPDQRKECFFSSGIDDLGVPRHVLVPNRNRRSMSVNLVCHVCSRNLQSGSFVRIREGVYAGCPELTFCQMAEYLSLAELIALGFEYCGTYAMDENRKECHFGVPALTTTAKLQRYARNFPSARYIEKARKAASFVRDGSASPMETALYMLMCLDRRMGGYALPDAILNYEIALDENARKIYRHGSCRCDLYFPEAGVDLEYNGRDYHFGKDVSDHARSMALDIMGCTCVMVSAMQFWNDGAMSEIARKIASRHGRRVRRESEKALLARYKLKRALNSYLHGWNRT